MRAYQDTYKILSEIGHGGMGTVYLVKHETMGVLRAMKAVPKDADTSELPAEVEILTNLEHPCLVKIIDVFEDPCYVYIVQDYIQGINMAKRLEKVRRFSEEDVRKWAKQLCEALRYLHEPKRYEHRPSIIHRDIKPGNIMMTPSGDIKLIDFGIAKKFKDAATADSIHIGTLGYAAPEQFNDARTDARTDIYGLGATLHHMITGQKPVPFALKPARELNKSCSEGLEYIIQKCTQTDPRHRYQSVAELQRDLENIENFGNMRERRKRREGFKLAGCFMIFALGVFLASYGAETVRAEQQAAYREQYEQGMVMLDAGDIDAAGEILYAADKSANRGDGHKAIAAAYMNNDNGERCLSVIKDTVAKYPEMTHDAELNYYWGLALEDLGSNAEALSRFKTAAENAPDNIIYKYYLARAYAKNGQSGDAEAVLQEVKGRTNESITAFVHGGILEAQSSTAKAAEQYKLCIDTAKEDEICIAAYRELANLYRNSRSHDAAALDNEITVLKGMRRAYPNDEQAFVLERLGEACYTKSNFAADDEAATELRQESVSCFKELISLGYSRASTYLNIAIVCQRMADYDGAEEALMQMLDKYPQNSDAYVQLAFLVAEREGAKPQSKRNYSAMADYYKKAVELGASGEKIQRLEGVIADLRSAGWIR